MFFGRKNKENRPDPEKDPSVALRAGNVPVSSVRSGREIRGGRAKYVPGFRFCPADLFVLILILAASGMLYCGIAAAAAGNAAGTSRLEAVLTVSGREVWRADISKGASSQSYQVTGISGHLTVRTEAGRACISYSDCPDQICVRTGWISAAGQSAVCLPNRCVLTIETSAGSAGTETAASSAYDIVSK